MIVFIKIDEEQYKKNISYFYSSFRFRTKMLFNFIAEEKKTIKYYIHSIQFIS